MISFNPRRKRMISDHLRIVITAAALAVSLATVAPAETITGTELKVAELVADLSCPGQFCF